MSPSDVSEHQLETDRMTPSQRTRPQKCQRQLPPDSASVSERVSGVGSEEATDWVRITAG